MRLWESLQQQCPAGPVVDAEREPESGQELFAFAGLAMDPDQ